MTTREKILVGLMCLAILYGAYELFWTPSTRKVTKQKVTATGEDLHKFAGEVTQKLVKEKLPEVATYRIEKASTSWTKDPFLQTASPLTATKPSAPSVSPAVQNLSEQPDLVYTGYLQLGDKMMAVINGMEYAVGESLGANDLYVKHITGQSVTIGKVKSKETIQLPLYESTEK